MTKRGVATSYKGLFETITLSLSVLIFFSFIPEIPWGGVQRKIIVSAPSERVAGFGGRIAEIIPTGPSEVVAYYGDLPGNKVSEVRQE